ncbi:MAG: 50S ribosomal protein L35ae [Candidatus Woesearchaeota archaeon]|nr:50S ribosomal protein L35ae [Candidatus Woesearchaeota archaeon]
MEGVIHNYKRGPHRVTPNQMIVLVDSVSDKEAAAKLVGKKVVYNTGKKDIAGEVRAAHGNKGALRVLFETGMPGQAIGKAVSIQ